MSSLGEILKTERIRQGKGLKDIEKETRIRAKYLLAIEKGEFDILPGGAYPKAFIKAYCQCLGIDSSLLLEHYQSLVASSKKEEAPKQSGFRPRFREPSKDLTIYTGTRISLIKLVIIILLLLLLYFRVLQPLLFSKRNAPVPATQNVAPASLTKQKNIRIKVDEPGAWIKITVDSAVAFEGIAGSNNNFEFKGESFIIKTGNAAVVNVSYAGSNFAPLGNLGQVVEKSFGKEDSVGKTKQL